MFFYKEIGGEWKKHKGDSYKQLQLEFLHEIFLKY